MHFRAGQVLTAVVCLAASNAFANEEQTRSAAWRDRVDRLALARPGASLEAEVFETIKDIPDELLGFGAVDATQEARLAASAHARFLTECTVAPTPPPAQRTFDRLIAELPLHLKPDAFAWRLTVLDSPGRDAFTPGAGFVEITRSWADALLADPDRGGPALSFVLAHEIGQVALGRTRRAWERRETLALFEPLIPERLASVRLDFMDADCGDVDRFALHLCRNAGFDLDAALDPLRAAGRPPHDEAATNDLARLRGLLMERDGTFDDETTHGLFLYDRSSGRLDRCGPGAVGPGERPVIFVHGLRGTEHSFDAYLAFFAERPELAGRPLLVFRYPNNESLSRCGQFLTREMRRVVADPDGADFVCHSAGGLVFRWYAEVRQGGFDRAVFLATPHTGTPLIRWKVLVDVSRFFLDLPRGLDYALADEFGEGGGQVARDLAPDSLFLRRLGRETPPAGKYRIFYGQIFDWLGALKLQAALLIAKPYAQQIVVDFVPFAAPQNRLTRRLDEWSLPEEILTGDLSVSVRSARLSGVTATGLPLMHEAFRSDPGVMRRVLGAVTRP